MPVLYNKCMEYREKGFEFRNIGTIGEIFKNRPIYTGICSPGTNTNGWTNLRFVWIASIVMDKILPNPYSGMGMPVEVTLYGYSNAECGPFPCDEYRTCGLVECSPKGTFSEACRALENALKKEYGERVRVRMVPLDEGVPDEIRPLIEEQHPAVPIVLVNGRLVPLGRVSLSHLKKFLTG